MCCMSIFGRRVMYTEGKRQTVENYSLIIIARHFLRLIPASPIKAEPNSHAAGGMGTTAVSQTRQTPGETEPRKLSNLRILLRGYIIKRAIYVFMHNQHTFF